MTEQAVSSATTAVQPAVAQKNQEAVWFMWKQTWRFSKGNRPRVVLYIALSLIANLFSFAQPLFLAWLLNVIQKEGVTQKNIPLLLFITSSFIFLEVLFWLCHGPSRVIETKNSFYVRAQYKKYLVDGVLALPPEWHAEHHSGDTIDRIEKGTQGLYRYSSNTYEVIEAIMRLVGGIAALFFFNLSSGLVAILFVVLVVLIVFHYDKTLRVQHKELNEGENATSQKVFDFISNINTVIILRIERVASSEIYKKIMKPFQTFSKYTELNEIKWSLVSLVASMLVFFVIGLYFVNVAFFGEALLVGSLIALYGYANNISGLFFRFAYKYGDIIQQKSTVENADVLARDFATKPVAESVSLKEWKRLSVRNLTFSYDIIQGKKREQIHLDDVSLTIRKGEKIALIGESGSGKTTFLKLVRGLYAPQRCTLLLDGNPVKGFENISEDMSLIPQDPELFTATIRENITMGIDCTEEDIVMYTDMACFTRVIERLPKRIESHIKEKGVNLSGGEKQRLALARGLLASREKEIIMLDEPTSSVDSKNEMQIYKNIFEAHKDTTIISSIHRLHLLTQFDTVYFFKSGRIIASGTLEKLLKTSPEFKQLWKKYHATRKKER